MHLPRSNPLGMRDRAGVHALESRPRADELFVDSRGRTMRLPLGSLAIEATVDHLEPLLPDG